jgi:hypothetical protein
MRFGAPWDRRLRWILVVIGAAAVVVVGLNLGILLAIVF